MIALLCTDARYLADVRAALPPALSPREVPGWRELEQARPAAHGAVVVLPCLDDAHRARIQSFKAAAPRFPLVLATRRDAATLLSVRDLPVEEVVWLGTMARELASAVSRARGRALLLGVARRVEAAVHLPAALRDALAMACGAPRAPVSVAGLAGAVGRDRTTLCRQWRRAAGSRTVASLDRFLQWALLVRALETRACGRKWEAVAAEVGVHPHTLSRMAVRLAGVPLQALAAAGTGAAFQQFLREVVDPLLAGAEGPPGSSVSATPAAAGS